jgi:hypothetical protein
VSSSLRKFQLDTVDFVLSKLNSRSTYAIADEVGLGKTRVVAEIALRLVQQRPYHNTHIVFYIAPAFELINQNRDAIESYIRRECEARNIKRDVLSFTSRLTRIDHDIVEHGKSERPRVLVIGLSPETSFKVNGKGSLAEREILAARLTYGRWAERRGQIEDYFWCLEGKPSKEFRERIEKHRLSLNGDDARTLQADPQIERFLEELFLLSVNKPQGQAAKAIRDIVGKIRNRAVEKWLERSEFCTLLILDEWHRYKKVCFEKPLLRKMIEKVRGHTRTKMLLVSATPFSVNFEDQEGGSTVRRKDDFKDLFELYYGEAEAPRKYDRFLEIQNRYLTSVEALLRGADQTIDIERSAYQEALHQICVRTERPHPLTQGKDENLLLTGQMPDWRSLSRSLASLLKKAGPHDCRGPVSQLWADGHKFFENSEYKISKQAATKDIPGDHWKLEQLRAVITNEYRGDALHSSKRPPLWLSSYTKAEKHLVFTEYTFLPEEISRGLKYGALSSSATKSGSVLGTFPMPQKGSKRHSVEKSNLQKNIHWIYFYPWIAFETGRVPHLSPGDLLKILSGAMTLADAVIGIERYFGAMDPTCLKRIDARARIIKAVPSATLTPLLRKEFAKVFCEGAEGSEFPGVILSRAASTSGLIGGSERNYLEFAAGLMRLFASPEARCLAAHWQKKRRASRARNFYVSFALWYSQRYSLGAVLTEYFHLVLANTSGPDKAFIEAVSAIGLRRASNGSRCARPFQDRKEGDGQDGDGMEKASVKSLRNAFNSPFPPFVLVSTSVGQEGLDFHRYCDRVIHWSPPSSPSALQQREGRVDRFRSLQNRKVDSRSVVPDEAGFSPDFISLDRNGNRLNKTQRFVLALPLSAQAARWKRCLQRLYYSNVLIGVPDPMAVEKRFEAVLQSLGPAERERRLKAFAGICISLVPRCSRVRKRAA